MPVEVIRDTSLRPRGSLNRACDDQSTGEGNRRVDARLEIRRGPQSALGDGESPSIVARNFGISLATLEKHYAAAHQRRGTTALGNTAPGVGNATGRF
jgi:hypothetical protein